MDSVVEIAKTVADTSIEAVLPAVEAKGWTWMDGSPDVVATSRHVFDTGRGTVVKVPQAESFRKHNRGEGDGWEMCRDPTLVAPVVAHGDDCWWVEQVKCRQLDGPQRPLENAYIGKLQNSAYYITDVHLDNLAINPHNRELVCVDYPSLIEDK